jgi:hypothetical protein
MCLSGFSRGERNILTSLAFIRLRRLKPYFALHQCGVGDFSPHIPAYRMQSADRVVAVPRPGLLGTPGLVSTPACASLQMIDEKSRLLELAERCRRIAPDKMGRTSAFALTRAYLNVAIYSAISTISTRLSDKLGMFGWGLSRRNASLFASKAGIFASEANDGA